MEVPRNALQLGRDLLATFPAVVIQGARQVGKSTLAGQLVSGEKAVSVTLDDRATRDSAAMDERGFVEQHNNGTLVIDEVQREPELLLAIKQSIDTNREPGRFLLTGSADMLSVKGSTDSLAGRAVTLRLRGLSQGEVEGHKEDFVASVARGQYPPDFKTTWSREAYISAIEVGGYPEVRQLNPRMRAIWIDSYIERVLTRDAITLPSGSNTARLRAILSLVAANQAGELVKARYADKAGIPTNTITSYLDVLNDLFLVEELPSWSTNLTKRAIARPKIFVADSAIAMRLNRLTAQHLAPLTADSIGPLFEAFVASELLKQSSWTEQPFQLFHFRDRNGLEVDLLAELEDGRVIAFEIKASSSYRASQFTGLAALRDKLGDRLIAGFVLGMSDVRYRFADRLYGLPAAALWQPHN